MKAIVPPLTPGIKLAIPIKIPFRNNIICCMIYLLRNIKKRINATKDTKNTIAIILEYLSKNT